MVGVRQGCVTGSVQWASRESDSEKPLIVLLPCLPFPAISEKEWLCQGVQLQESTDPTNLCS